MTAPNNFRAGDIVRIKNEAKHIDHANRWGIATNTDLVVKMVDSHFVHLVGHVGGIFATRFVLAPPPRKTPITAIKVPTDDVMVVLNRYVKEELGIDATVDKVISSFTNSLELVFKEAA
ncbi:hypothetical protein [Sinorhizobium medicae]|uniref:hypothetical protein n=1 Tax=Sinorhizobium medicae TaxID=110321 RepID=UPI000FD74859|nr:hypothetical protein [Sinorhizobium medicae]RVP50031.1 hypothetical protein CN078_21575 [Sinorhizobium medicae]RVP74849.1 hypothetical protein CN079_20970 [Sinorhizobium medicae]UWU09427.1 hypothetical protein N2598_06710 [Sinorhizobium medicae]